MSVNYTSVAGYGVRANIEDLLPELADEITDNFDGSVVDYFEAQGIDYSEVGSYYSGYTDVFLVFEDPLQRVEKFETFKEELKAIVSNPTVKWINDILVS